jgi:DNA repair exonuclease SbcCD ATPase subunit
MAENYNHTKKRRTPVLLIILLFALAGALIYLYMEYDKQMDKAEMVEKELKIEKEELTRELENMHERYDSLKTENDTINRKLELEQKKIERLLQVRASNLQKIRLYRKELGTLREIMKSYVVQIDSLNRRNEMLRAENKEVKTKLRETEETNVKLKEDKEELTQKVQKAEVLTATNIAAVGLNSRSKEKDKVDKIEKLRVCFTVRENAIAEAGRRFIYLRIIRPDEVVLTSSAENMIQVNGKQIIYSAKRELNYENKDIDMCIYYDNTEEELIPGTYHVKLYSKGFPIGETTFTLQESGFLFF